MTDTLTPAPTQVHPSLAISTDRLRALFGAVLPHVQVEEDDEATLPPLDCVNVDVFDGYLHLIGSDRFTLAVVREKLDGFAEVVTRALSLNVERVGQVLAALKDDTPVLVTIEADKVRLAQKGVSLHLDDEKPHVRLPWRKPLHDAIVRHQAPHMASVGVNPKFLARLDAARDLAPESPMRLFTASGEVERKTILATLTDSFIAVIAPVSDEHGGPTWADALDSWRDTVDPARPAPGGTSAEAAA
jgi:hypothetical protein